MDRDFGEAGNRGPCQKSSQRNDAGMPVVTRVVIMQERVAETQLPFVRSSLVSDISPSQSPTRPLSLCSYSSLNLDQ